MDKATQELKVKVECGVFVEADDLIIERASLTPRSVIACIDKDIIGNAKTLCFNYKHNKFIEPNELEANVFELKQCIIGDSTDNIKGVAKIGEKKTQSLFQPYLDRFKQGEFNQSYALLREAIFNEVVLPLYQSQYGELQGECILEFLKDRPSKEHAFKIAINNTQIQMNQIQYEQIKQDEILKFFPLYEIPLIKSGEMEIVRKIKTDKVLLRDLLEKSLQGNINTIHLKDIQDQKETNGRIYKGANCHRYFLDTQYLFAKDNQITQQIFEKNYYQNIIVTQNITGTSDAYRIHANLIEVKNQEMLFLNTCNLSYCKEREHAKFLVGLLNSRLLDWLFRKTSTNNHVNLYELETLPIPQITKSNQPTARKITDCAKAILEAKEKDPKANTQQLEKEIDALVYQLYHLTDEEIKIIEEGQEIKS